MLGKGIQEVHDWREHKLEHPLHSVSVSASVLLKYTSLMRGLTFARTPTVDTTAWPWNGGWVM
jgi:hypothetical protein